LAATGAPFYFTQKTARNERFLVISCGFLLWTYVTVPFFILGTKSLKNAFDVSNFYSLFHALLLGFTQLLTRKVRMNIKKNSHSPTMLADQKKKIDAGYIIR